MLSLPGALFVLLARAATIHLRVYHARQSLALAIVGDGRTTGLGGGRLGPGLDAAGRRRCSASSLFALVIAAYVGLLISWITGMVYALQGQVQPMPLFGALGRATPTRRAGQTHTNTRDHC